MTLYEKSQGILELPAVLELLKQEAVSAAGKEKAVQLFPSTDIYEVRQRLSETSAAKKMMTIKGSPSFSGVKDVSASLSRADRGGMLNTRELLDIAGVLKAARGVISYADGEDVGKSTIDYLFSGLTANKYLEEKISISIAGEDEITDSASSELADIRRHMRIAGDKVRQSLQKIISSPSYSKALQEPIITMRNDRYVVPIKSEYRASVPGLVHDISSSGATLFIEPMSSVEANNEIRELLAKEKKEIERILAALSAEAAADKEDIIRDVSVLTELDLIFAKAKLSYKLDCMEPVISEYGRIIIKKGRHPLLPKAAAVPIDVYLGEEFDTLVITGPNTGGKTVSLKTIGLMCIMAASGLHIPAADGSEVPVFEKVLADIGDEQSIEQSLSTFSAHMTNIVKILDECGKDTLLLFDELGAGTDPTEGAALAIAIIEYSRKLGAMVAATTHYSELKLYATTSEGVQNASCEFDVDTLRPTYRLLIGIPGKSNAFAISSRLGLSDIVIDDARSRVGVQSARFEEVLERLEISRQEMEKEKLEIRKRLREAEENAKKSEVYRSKLEKEHEKAAEMARKEAEEIIADARRIADKVLEEVRAIRKSAEKSVDFQKINDASSTLRHRLNEAEDKLRAKAPEKKRKAVNREIQVGDTVEILSMGAKAVVQEIKGDGSVLLRAGVMSITVNKDEVELVEGVKTEKTGNSFKKGAETKLRNLAVKPELDLRGMMTDEAIPVMEKYLDSAMLAGLNEVTVIHGKGTGALRAAVHQTLRGNKRIKSFRLGRYGEGEMGVTVVTLK